MQFVIDIDGVRIPIQIVKRGKKTFWRIIPSFLHDTIPKQREVRNTLAMASSENFGNSRNEINKAVADAFVNWESNKTAENETAVEQTLKDMFGKHEVDAVRTYYEHKDRETTLNRYRRRKLREENRGVILSPNVPRVPIPLKKEKSVSKIIQNAQE